MDEFAKLRSTMTEMNDKIQEARRISAEVDGIRKALVAHQRELQELLGIKGGGGLVSIHNMGKWPKDLQMNAKKLIILAAFLIAGLGILFGIMFGWLFPLIVGGLLVYISIMILAGVTGWRSGCSE